MIDIDYSRSPATEALAIVPLPDSLQALTGEAAEELRELLNKMMAHAALWEAQSHANRSRQITVVRDAKNQVTGYRWGAPEAPTESLVTPAYVGHIVHQVAVNRAVENVSAS
jgi:hypothetical protein